MNSSSISISSSTGSSSSALQTTVPVTPLSSSRISIPTIETTEIARITTSSLSSLTSTLITSRTTTITQDVLTVQQLVASTSASSIRNPPSTFANRPRENNESSSNSSLTMFIIIGASAIVLAIVGIFVFRKVAITPSKKFKGRVKPPELQKAKDPGAAVQQIRYSNDANQNYGYDNQQQYYNYGDYQNQQYAGYPQYAEYNVNGDVYVEEDMNHQYYYNQHPTNNTNAAIMDDSHENPFLGPVTDYRAASEQLSISEIPESEHHEETQHYETENIQIQKETLQKNRESSNSLYSISTFDSQLDTRGPDLPAPEMVKADSQNPIQSIKDSEKEERISYAHSAATNDNQPIQLEFLLDDSIESEIDSITSHPKE